MPNRNAKLRKQEKRKKKDAIKKYKRELKKKLLKESV